MNFITPLLFVFFLQVMPPPPPTMFGGGEYWAGDTVDENNVVIIPGWTVNDLTIALRGLTLAGYTNIGYVGFDNVLDAIDDGYIINLTITEWTAIFNEAPFWETAKYEKACRVAFGYGGTGETVALTYNCVPEAPLPKGLLFLITLSFLGVYYFFKRDELSKFIRISTFNR